MKTETENERKVRLYFRKLIAQLEAKRFYATQDAVQDLERDYRNLYWVYYSE